MFLLPFISEHRPIIDEYSMVVFGGNKLDDTEGSFYYWFRDRIDLTEVSATYSNLLNGNFFTD